MVPSQTPRQIAVWGKFCQNTLCFQWNIALLSISSCPPLLWAGSAQMPPKCFPNASQMPLRCLSDDSQMPSRSQMPLRCLPSLAPLLSPPWFYSIDLNLPWWQKTILISMMFSPIWFFFIDLSFSWFRKTCLGSRAGVIWTVRGTWCPYHVHMCNMCKKEF